MEQYNHTLSYKTFDELLAELNIDLMSPTMDKTIQPQQLIKVATRVNFDLGLRIQKTKETTVEIINGKAKLPKNFYTLNYAFVCGSYTVTSPVIQGTQVEEVLVNQGNCGNEEDCSVPYTCVNDCGGYVQLIQRFKNETRTYDFNYPLFLKQSKEVGCNCPNTKTVSGNTGYIKEGWLITNFSTGTVYLNYQTNMEDSDGQLLVADHPLLNEYYEYALKERIFENRVLMGDNNVINQWQLIKEKLRVARKEAVTFVNTPNFSELREIWEMNRIAQYHKYYNMFKS